MTVKCGGDGDRGMKVVKRGREGVTVGGGGGSGGGMGPMGGI